MCSSDLGGFLVPALPDVPGVANTASLARLLSEVTSIDASGLIVAGVGGILGAETAVLDVSGLLGVESAPVSVLGQDGNIVPCRGSPVGVVVTLLDALITVTVAIVVLAGVDGSTTAVSLKTTLASTVGNEETEVAVTSLAHLVVGVRLMETIGVSTRSILGGGTSGGVGDGVGGGTITDAVVIISSAGLAHVLDDDIAHQSGVTSATVLGSPLDLELGASIEVHGGTTAISSLSVVLGVEQAVSIVTVSVGLIVTVVGTTRVLHVKISCHEGDDARDDDKSTHF